MTDGTAHGRAPRRRLIHLAARVNAEGGMSAACFSSPRAIDLSRATWTIRPEAVTCPKCRALAAARRTPPSDAR